MKNRKAPVMLFGIVVIAVGAMTVFNAMQKPQDPEAKQEQKAETVAERKTTPADIEAAGDLLRKKLGPAKSARKNTAVALNETGITVDVAKEPTIYLQSTSSFRPAPNEASPQAQWYRENSRASQVAEEFAKSKG